MSGCESVWAEAACWSMSAYGSEYASVWAEAVCWSMSGCVWVWVVSELGCRLETLEYRSVSAGSAYWLVLVARVSVCQLEVLAWG